MLIDKSGWSGDGDLTIGIVGVLERLDEIAALKVEDAPASRAGAGYNLLANEIFVTVGMARASVRSRWLGIVPVTRVCDEPSLTLTGLEARLAAIEGIGPADYADEGMLQYLRAQRVVPPYQTRGYKLVEMVRVYLARANEPVHSDRH